MSDPDRIAYFLLKPVARACKEFDLLAELMRNEGAVLSRDLILSRVWGYDYYGDSRTVDVHIRRLRSKLEDARHSFIETVRNVGYRFRVSPSPMVTAEQSAGLTEV